MRAVVIDTPGSYAVATHPDPTPGRGQVVIAPRAVGICGTDLHIIDGEFPPTPYPIVPGHEFAGEVVALGPGVADGPSGLRVGDRAAVDPSLFCGACRNCQRQRGNLCENWNATGDTVDGAFAEYVAVPADTVHPLADSLSWDAGALVEPLSCAVHGIRRMAMPPGSELLIVGAGTMGLLLAQVAMRAGAASVSVVDTEPSRLQLAADLGVGQTAASVGELVSRRGRGFDFAAEATGNPAALRDAMDGLDRGATILIFGVAPQQARVEISPFSIYNDEISVIGSMAVLHTFPHAISLLEAGAVDVPSMVTATLPLARFDEAVAGVRNREGLKTQVAPQQ